MDRAESRRQRKKAEKAAKNAMSEQEVSPSSEQHTLTIQQAIDLGIEHHTAGRLPEAEGIYQQILQADPNQPIALHLLGLIAHQVGKNDVAKEFITKAIAINPGYAEAHYNLGNVLKELGQIDEAVAHYQKAIDFKPAYAKAHNNFGVALQFLCRPDEAVARYRQAIDIQPDFVEAYNNLGLVLHGLGQLDEAVASYQKAIDINPSYFEAYSNLGLTFQEMGRLDDSIDSYRKAIAINPDYIVAHNNLAYLFQDMERLDEAEKIYRKLLELEPDNTLALVQLGDVLNDIAFNLRQTDEKVADPSKSGQLLWKALTFADRALSLIPGDSGALALKSIALLGLNRHDDWAALCEFDRLIQTLTMSVPEGYADIATFNEALLQRCANDQSQTFEPFLKPLKKGYRIRFLQNDPKSSPVNHLLEFVNKAAEQYRTEHPVNSRHPFLAQSPRNWDIDAWGTILERQGHHGSHIHGAGWLSGVYYGKLPDVMATENKKREGFIKFGRPKNYIDNESSPEFHFIRPQEGMMILFPSYFYHQTVPFESDGIRFAVSFDLIPLSR